MSKWIVTQDSKCAVNIEKIAHVYIGLRDKYEEFTYVWAAYGNYDGRKLGEYGSDEEAIHVMNEVIKFMTTESDGTVYHMPEAKGD